MAGPPSGPGPFHLIAPPASDMASSSVCYKTVQPLNHISSSGMHKWEQGHDKNVSCSLRIQRRSYHCSWPSGQNSASWLYNCTEGWKISPSLWVAWCPAQRGDVYPFTTEVYFELQTPLAPDRYHGPPSLNNIFKCLK